MANDLDGKVFLITGGTEGIGKAAALEFARRGATLVLVGRNREKSERVVADLKAASGNPHIELLLGDMSKLADVRAVAAAFKAAHDRLDVLVNNAGAVFAKHQLSADGFEMTFALNHLAYFLLTHELLDVLRKTPGARVVSTSSGAHTTGRIDIDDIARRANGRSGFRAYTDSKLANVLFTRELARRIEGSGVTVTCFHPGFVQTGFGLNNPGLIAKGIKLAGSLFARTPEKGAETLIWLATSADVSKSTGEYFHDRAVAPVSRRGRDDAMAKQLWALSERLCGISDTSPVQAAASRSGSANP